MLVVIKERRSKLDKTRADTYHSFVTAEVIMKRTDLIKLFLRNGWVFDREGGKHTIFRKGNKTEQIPRHREINEHLSRALIKKHNLK